MTCSSKPLQHTASLLLRNFILPQKQKRPHVSELCQQVEGLQIRVGTRHVYQHGDCVCLPSDRDRPAWLLPSTASLGRTLGKQPLDQKQPPFWPLALWPVLAEVPWWGHEHLPHGAATALRQVHHAGSSCASQSPVEQAGPPGQVRPLLHQPATCSEKPLEAKT